MSCYSSSEDFSGFDLDNLTVNDFSISSISDYLPETSDFQEDLSEVPFDSDFDPEIYFCGCGSNIIFDDIVLHSQCCFEFQPFINVEKITDPLIFEANGIILERSPITLRLRRQTGSLWQAASSGTNWRQRNKMSETESMLNYSELGDSPCSPQGDSHETLNTPPPAESTNSAPFEQSGLPAEMSIEIEDSKAQLGIINDIITQANSKNSEGRRVQEEEEEEEEEEERPQNGISSVENKSEEEKEEDNSSLKGPSNNEEETSDQSNQNNQGPSIRMRSIQDLIGTNGVKEEKVEEPFAALNVMLSNLKAPQTQPQQNKRDFEPVTTISSSVLPPNGSAPSVPNLPSGVQISVQKRPAPPPSFPPGVSVTKQPRRDSESSSTSSLSPAATPPPRLPEGITLVRPGQKASDPVANMLATRGVSVMPSTPRGEPTQAVSIRRAAPAPQPPANLVNNSALTITPKRARPSSVMTTVDLTDDTAAPPMRRPAAPAPLMRPRLPGITRGRSAAVTCDVCDKVFAHADDLRIHMQTHVSGRRGMVQGGPRGPAGMTGMRQPISPAYQNKQEVAECRFCTARYPNQQLLQQHTQRFHPERFGGAVGSEFALPVVDLRDPRMMGNLVNIGVKYCIPLAHLESAGGGGSYGLPVVPLDGAVNPAVCNFDKLNCSNLFPLGPLKGLRQ